MNLDLHTLQLMIEWELKAAGEIVEKETIAQIGVALALIAAGLSIAHSIEKGVPKKIMKAVLNK